MIIASKHIQSALRLIESILKKHDLSLRQRTYSPWPGTYHYESCTPVYEVSYSRLYAFLIVIICWLEGSFESGFIYLLIPEIIS